MEMRSVSEDSPAVPSQGGDLKRAPRYTLGPDQWPVDENGVRANYWDYRREMIYYRTLANFVRLIAFDAESLLDVGSAGCRYLEWFDWIPDRVSLDLSRPTRSPGIRSIVADFLAWTPDKRYPVITCSQVLEHVENVEAFARKLLATGDRVLISVPYKWSAGSVKGHVHDPVDESKVRRWFGCDPDYTLVVKEPFAESRLFCFFDPGKTFRRPSHAELMTRLLSHPIAGPDGP